MTQKPKADPASLDLNKVSTYYFDLALKYFNLPGVDVMAKEDFLRALLMAYRKQIWSIVDASHNLLPQRHTGSLHTKLTLEEKVMLQKDRNAVRLHREWLCNCRNRQIALSADGFFRTNVALFRM